MSDIEVENYKKSLTRIVEDWGKEASRIARELGPVNEELDKLESIDKPSPDDKKRITELEKKRDALHEQMDEASMSLNVNLVVIEVPPKADEKELGKVPAWLKEIIKHKGIPLGHGVSIAPTVDFDIKKRKLKSIGVVITW